MRNLFAKFWTKKSCKVLLCIIAAVLLAIVIYLFFSFKIIQVQGNSMYDTLRSGSFVLVDKRAETVNSIKKGDIILFQHYIEDRPYEFIKRIVGTEGSVISSCDEELCIDGTVIKGCKYISNDTIKLQKNELFVVGDNYDFSTDSREFGVISTDSVIGLVIN